MQAFGIVNCCMIASCAISFKTLLEHFSKRWIAETNALILLFSLIPGSAQVACYTELGCSSGSLGSFPSALDCCIRDDGLSHESGSEPCLACLCMEYSTTVSYIQCCKYTLHFV